MENRDGNKDLHEFLELSEKYFSKYVEKFNCQKFELKFGEMCICCERAVYVGKAQAVDTLPNSFLQAEQLTNFKEVKSDMVGTIYISPSPADAPYIIVGSPVKEGQTIFIIEAMKVMNHFKSPYSGIVKEILIQNEQVVEYGQVLVRIV